MAHQEVESSSLSGGDNKFFFSRSWLPDSASFCIFILVSAPSHDLSLTLVAVRSTVLRSCPLSDIKANRYVWCLRGLIQNGTPCLSSCHIWFATTKKTVWPWFCCTPFSIASTLEALRTIPALTMTAPARFAETWWSLCFWFYIFPATRAAEDMLCMRVIYRLCLVHTSD